MTNVFSIVELEREVQRGALDVLVIGHNLPAPEKRRVHDYAKNCQPTCKVVEIYRYMPELISAAAHVCWDEGSDVLIEAVNRAMSAPFE